MKKEQFERALEASQFKLIKRVTLNGQEFFIADRFVPPGQLKYLYTFGVKATEEEHPFGAFATICYPEKKNGLVSAGIADAFHDPGHSQEAKEQLRANAVLALATRTMN